MGKFRSRAAKKLIALVLSTATVLGVVGVVMAPPASAALPLASPNGKLLPDKPLQAPLDAVLSTVKGVQETIAALQNAVSVLTTGLNGDGTPANPGLVADIKAYVQDLAADPANAPTSAPGFLTGALLPPALTIVLPQALSLLQKISSPICPIIGATASLQNVALPTIPDYSLFGSLAPAVKQYDQTGQNILTNVYATAMAKLLAPITAPAGLETLSPYLLIANLVLSLFKTNWHSVYYPPDGSAPIVHDTAGVMFLPALVDVDNNLGFDICANMNADLLGGTMKLTQQIARIPTSDPNMQLDINGSITIALGDLALNLGAGYDTKGSHVPAMFDTTTTLATNTPIATQLNVPGPTFVQYQNTGVTIAGIPLQLQSRFETTNPPHTYNFSQTSAKNSAGTTIATVSKFAASDRVAMSAFRSHTTGNLAGLPIDLWSGVGATSTPNWEYCTSTNSGYCSNAPDALKSAETASQHVITNGNAEVFEVSTPSFTNTACPTGTHIKSSRFFYGAKIPTSTSTAGHAWIDTDGGDLVGCAGSNATYPATVKAQDRLATWTGTGPVLSKSGALVCPSGTLMKTGTVTTSGYLCPSAPPVNTVAPTITGDAYEGNVLTANPGTWTPAAPNNPAFTYQWKSCSDDGSGEVCTDIPGATAKTYTPTHDDVNKTLRVVVKGTNLEGSSTAPISEPTAPIQVPPAPLNTLLPVITGDPGIGSGHVLTSTTGTWSYFPTFTQQWQRCDLDGTNCAAIADATSLTYAATADDEGHALNIIVTGTNPGGSTSATSANVVIPGAIANTVAPTIISNDADASGAGVLQDDIMEIDLGSWDNAASFTYQWLRCDGSSCAPIAGQTGNTYQLTADDIGHSVAVTVTGHNGNAGPHGTLAIDTPQTGLVERSPLATKAAKDVVDGVAYAAAGDASSTFVGGQFDTAGTARAHGGLIGQSATSTASGTPSTFNARANGDILSTVADGAGGYYIAGNFTKVFGRACPGFAHIKSTSGTPSIDLKYCIPGLVGEVRSFSFNTASSVHMLALAGSFTLAGHSNWAFFDYTPATLTPIFPTDGDPNGTVNSITNNASTSFIAGGSFTKVGTVDRGGLVQEAVATAPSVSIAQAAWPAAVCQTATVGGACTGAGVVNYVSYSSLGLVVVGGSFTGYYRTDGVAVPGGTATTFRSNAAAVFTTLDSTNANFGLPAGWSPNPNGPLYTTATAPIGLSNLSGPYGVYLGGSFTRVGGTFTTGAAVSAAPTGTPLTVANLAEWAIKSDGTNSTSGTGTNASPSTTFTPYVNGPVYALWNGSTSTAAPGSSLNPAAPLFVGGAFTKVGTSAATPATAVTRMRLAKIAPRAPVTGSAVIIDATWAPVAGNTVYALSGQNSAVNTTTGTLFAAGKFRVLGGVIRNNIANFDSTGTVTAWDGDGGTDGAVRALEVKGGVVYAGGDFARAGGANRSRLAAFNTTGSAPLLTSWAPEATGSTVTAIAAKASSLLVGGSFSNVGGAAKSNLAEVNDSSGAAVAGFTASANGAVKVIKVVGPATYVGGSFTDLGNHVAKIDSDTGAPVGGWSVSTDGDVNALAITNDGAYIGGSFTNINGTARPNLGLVDPSGVVVAGWTPNVNGTVNALAMVDVNILVGGQFTSAGGKTRVNLALLDTLTGATTGFHPDPKTGPVYAVLSYSPGAGVFGDFSTTGVYDTAGVAFFG